MLQIHRIKAFPQGIIQAQALSQREFHRNLSRNHLLQVTPFHNFALAQHV